MKILITGASGFIGRALSARLVRDGHNVHAVVRNDAAARELLGPAVHVVSWRDADQVAAAVMACDAVIHLAGEPIVGKRWTDAQKAALRDSRINTANVIARHAALRRTPLQVVVGASAIGYYGNRGDEILTEASAGGHDGDFAVNLCSAWEQASRDIPAQRHVAVRVGLVLGSDGGLLKTMTPTFRIGLGAVLGDGKAWQSWIHIDDLVEIFARAVSEPDFRGTYNATAPNPVSNREFSDELAARYGKRVRLAAPRWALRGALGEAATMVLTSTRALPAALQQQGFVFRYATVREALADLINRNTATT